MNFNSASWKFIVSFLILFSFSSCNHLFYYPSPKTFATPDQLKLEYESFSIKVSDEVTLQGWHIFPKRKLEKPLAILQFHGNADNRTSHFLSIAWLANAGADLVVFDYRGYDGSTGTPSRSGLVEDGVAALKWFQQKFPTSRRFVIGQSIGGAVSVPSIAKAQVPIEGLILESTFYSYRGIARMKLSSIWLTWPFQWMPWILLSGDENAADYADQLKMPVLAFHDRGDPVVPYEAGEQLYNRFSPQSTRLISTEGALHIGAFGRERPQLRDEALKFLGLQ